jgi:hypothetical protein
MRNLALGLLAVVLAVSMGAGQQVAATGGERATMPAFTQPSPMTCSSAAAADLRELFAPTPSQSCDTIHHCSVASDCYNYCCVCWQSCSNNVQCTITLKCAC